MRRFWDKVEKTEDCWLWMASRKVKGYGQFCWRGRPRPAHRVAWELTHGQVPEGLCVLHRCDNPPCVNPVHLFLGTPADNTRDMMEKGRQGGGHPHRTDARLVRALHDQGMLQCEIARVIGIDSSAVCRSLQRSQLSGTQEPDVSS